VLLRDPPPPAGSALAAVPIVSEMLTQGTPSNPLIPPSLITRECANAVDFEKRNLQMGVRAYICAMDASACRQRQA
jgi:hypothetical protein